MHAVETKCISDLFSKCFWVTKLYNVVVLFVSHYLNFVLIIQVCGGLLR